VRIKNVSGKRIVGLVFNAALADATEHWKWLHWDFDEGRPVREFGWNKLIKNGEVKKLSWYRADIDFEHGGGGAFVLTSALFDDGSVWEEPGDSASCKYAWYNSHKKSFARPVELPFRPSNLQKKGGQLKKLPAGEGSAAEAARAIRIFRS